MKELILMVGPPASGKDTYIKDNYPDYIRISQDDQGKNAHLTFFIDSLKNNNNIIISRMNFNKEQRLRYLAPAKEAGYATRIVVLHESKETCFKRGRERNILGDHPTIKTEEDLGRAVNFFFKSYERPTEDEADTVEFRYPELSMKLYAVICDIDGTMANIDHRQHFVQGDRKDWKNFLLDRNVEQDSLNKWCRTITNSLRDNHIIVMCSGRPDNLRKTTTDWLVNNKVYHDQLFMRPRDDHRRDDIIKEIILDFEIKTQYDVVFALDDRQQVVDMWRRRGIQCLQVAPGDF